MWGVMMSIKECLERMCEIEFGCKLSDMKKTFFFIDDVNNKLIIKNYDDEIEFTDFINAYVNVFDYEYLQYFQLGYTFNECEIIEFELDDW